ncbi:MAG: CpsD/CapB family tyrosine-protein kinase [Eubacterium sp.]|nr:CpsD/CapB family tyrosine-protein kinase [Eubacterium sp.]CDD98626.1 putative uncharacterized protein [Roseburia sp. CAG:471]
MNKLFINEDEIMSQQAREVFRSFRSNIEFTGVDNRAIVITSCLPADGKSTVSLRLAMTFAESEKKTVLVDADMRRSVLMRRVRAEGDNASVGLSHVLSGQKSVTEALYETNLKNLYVIPSGKFPTNSTELLGNSRFEELIIALKKTFDYVIVDTPPLGSVVDAAVAAKRCDGSVLVISEGKDSRKMTKSVLEQLKAANPNFLGVAMNNVEVRKNNYYYKRYYNYYSHDKSMKED